MDKKIQEKRRLQLREASRRWRASNCTASNDMSDEKKKKRRQQNRESAARWRKKKKETEQSSKFEFVSGKYDLEYLVHRVMTMKWLDKGCMKAIEDHERYTSNVNLSLARFYSCQTSAEAWIYNDEQLCEKNNVQTRARLEQVLDSPVGPNEAVLVQKSISSSDENGRIFACASCNEIVFEHDGVLVCPIEELPTTYQLNDEERGELRKIPFDIVESHLSVLQSKDGKLYHLNPDLVQDLQYVVICKKCGENPKAYKFSIANGHDYGRLGNLPKLNSIALNCIRPFRIFGVHVSLGERKQKGHNISFASDGPTQCSQVLPWIPSNEELPTVTFFGSKSSWERRKKELKHQFDMPVDEIYAWLRVLSYIHRVFKDRNVIVDESSTKKQDILHCLDTIVDNVMVVTDKQLHEVYGAAKQEEDIEGDSDIQDNLNFSSSQSVVFPATSNSPTLPLNAAIETMLNIVIPSAKEEIEKTNVAIHRAEAPACEFIENDDILGGAFCHLFLTGKKLPRTILSKDFHNHCEKYYDGRFEDAQWIGYTFNQLQRSSAVRRAAHVGTTNSKALKRLGELANSEDFRTILENARDNPESSYARKINAQLMHVIALVGSPVPFSLFERATTRSHSMAMRYRYGAPLHFVTFSPPEQDDILLLRIASTSKWNTKEDIIRKQQQFGWSDLPSYLKENVANRVALSRRRPLLSAAMFERKLNSFCNDFVRCPLANKIRSSRQYVLRESGAFSTIAAINGIIEPQSNAEGRLHVHICLYGNTYSPELMCRLASCPDMSKRVAKWIDSIVRTGVSDDTYRWFDNFDVQQRPRSGSVYVPDAITDYDGFVRACEKRIILTGIHEHKPGSCMKGKKGKYMCRLCRPAGCHDGNTMPLQIILHKTGNANKNEKPDVEGRELDSITRSYLDTQYNPRNGEFLQKYMRYPVIWEVHRDKKDSLFIECNTIMALMKCATNSAIISGEASAEAVNEYITKYMVKNEPGALTDGASVVLGAVNHIRQHPSVAEDSGSDLRTGKYLASRVVNSLVGACEWKPQLMAAALRDLRSQVSSEKFWFIFPYELVRYVHNLTCGIDSDDEEIEEELSAEVEKGLEALVNALTLDENDTNTSAGGTRRYVIDNKTVVFVSQATSYYNRGREFELLSPIEFEAMVDILPKRPKKLNKGRQQRDGKQLGNNHPLRNTHFGYLKTKYRTIMFGGRPPPLYPGNEADYMNEVNSTSVEWFKRMKNLVEYVMCCFIPWYLPEVDVGNCSLPSSSGPIIPATLEGFALLCETWDNSNATFIDKQRYRYIRNVIKAHYRCSINEVTCAAWRQRNAAWWKDYSIQQVAIPKGSNKPKTESDNRNEDIYGSPDEVFRLTQMAISGKNKDEGVVQNIQNTCLDLFSMNSHRYVRLNTRNASTAVFQHNDSASFHGLRSDSLKVIAQAVSKMENNSIEREQTQIESGSHNLYDELEQKITSITPCLATVKQLEVLNHIIGNIDNGKQCLTMLQGPGGSGKTFCIKKINEELIIRRMKAINCCPTGAGACLMPGGETLHRVFAANSGKEASGAQLDNLRTKFTNYVSLIIVDEVSMMSVDMLLLMNKRLQILYNSQKPFGGKSILLVGDFLQLPVCNGTSLYDVMYNGIQTNQVCARSLLQKFKVFYLEEHIRAKTCSEHTQKLKQFRSIPSTRPEGNQWSKKNCEEYKPITTELVNALTKPLTAEDIRLDEKWLSHALVITTGNLERAAFNNTMAKEFGRRENQVVLRWRRSLLKSLPAPFLDLLYNENERPQLFGYFVYNAPVQVLSNNNGNVAYGVANGTSARMHSVAWSDTAYTDTVNQLIQGSEPGSVVDLPYPPDFINVRLVDRDGSTWLDDLNLDQNYKSTTNGKIKESVIIPVGMLCDIYAKKNHYARIGVSKSHEKIHFKMHAVDLAFATTVWKAQGSTCDYLLVHLEPTSMSPSWRFEHLYVAFSRVKMASRLRCFPLSLGFDRKRLFNLRPKISVIKYRFDTQNGFWIPPKNVSIDGNQNQAMKRKYRVNKKIQFANDQQSNNFPKEEIHTNHSVESEIRLSGCNTCIMKTYDDYKQQQTFALGERFLRKLKNVPVQQCNIYPILLSKNDRSIHREEFTRTPEFNFRFEESVLKAALNIYNSYCRLHGERAGDDAVLLINHKTYTIGVLRVMLQIVFVLKQYNASNLCRKWFNHIRQDYGTLSTSVLPSRRHEIGILQMVSHCEKQVFQIPLTKTFPHSYIYCGSIHEHLSQDLWLVDDILLSSIEILAKSYNYARDIVCSPLFTSNRDHEERFCNTEVIFWLQRQMEMQNNRPQYAFLPIHVQNI